MKNGVINIYKEKGFTSHDVVAKLRGILKQKKIGHTGTLDPDAEGVLPVCLGKATKLCDLLTDKNKTYQAVLRLGIVTDTQDMTGTIRKESLVEVSEQEIADCMAGFLGEQMQLPPMYSAIKINGKKLYELAREGKEIERKARRVSFYDIQVEWIKLPDVCFTVTCSKGTYIRTLCHDIGERLGCGACMASLIRTRVERFSIEGSLTLSQIEKLQQEDALTDYIVSVEDMFEAYPKVYGLQQQDVLLHNGNALLNPENPVCTSPVRMYDSKGLFIGIYEYSQQSDRYVLVKMLMEEA